MSAHIDVHFSPRGGCQLAIVKELLAARSEIFVQAYSFTADPIGDALANAVGRGLTVQVLLDESNERESYSDLQRLISAGVPVLIDDKHAIAHNKVIVIDQEIVVTGSFNFTNQAETSNAENVLIVRGEGPVIAAYRQNFLLHRGHSRPPRPPSAEPPAKQDRRRKAA